MNQNEILLKIEKILQEKLNLQEKISQDTALVSEELLDSLEFMNYITLIEENFNVSISDDDIEKYQLGVVKNMINYLNK